MPTQLIQDFCAQRRQIIEREFSRMNEMQMQAVVQADGPLLILAGAGSGKTTVVVNRIACLIKYGSAYHSETAPFDLDEREPEQMRAFLAGCGDYDVRRLSVRPAAPWQILAITFTNKAAGELKERLTGLLGPTGEEVWAATFHATCARMLRRNGDRLGYTKSFTIYDSDDQKRLMKDVQKTLNIDDKMLPHRAILSEIGHAKDKLLSPEDYDKAMNVSDARIRQISRAYALYQKRLKEADAMDFDDLIYNAVRMLELPDVLDYYQNRFRYICVDEYQDTSVAQCKLVQQLAAGHQNLCVVGDDDQSIYRFRGATIENILSFERHYPGAMVIRLEQNYRSTGTILEAANAVIAHNLSRKGKKLWTALPDGEAIRVHTASDEREEARYIVDRMMDSAEAGTPYREHAVLYRMNAQANAIENVLLRSGVPYRVVGGHRFYERQEIRDVLAYLQVISNPADNLRLRRIVPVPRRGIGETTVESAMQVADSLGLSLFEVFLTAEQYPTLARAAGKLCAFAQLLQSLSEQAEELSLHELFELMLNKTGYLQHWIAQGAAEQDRVSNVNELSSTILQYELEHEEPSLSDFLEEIALVTDLDSMDNSEERVTLMTLHAAKGLEFDTVFLSGFEDGIFPGSQSITGGLEDMEEERRLCYVGITRARKQLFITKAASRMLFGYTNHSRPSRFLKEIPGRLTEVSGNVNAWMPDAQMGGFGGGYVKGSTAGSGTGIPQSSRPAAKPAAAAKPPVDITVYTAGMRVKHKMFGEGMVLSVTDMGNDALLEVAFDKVGTKRLMRNFSRMEVLS